MAFPVPRTARSSNGRTAAFGAVSGGSNPPRAASFSSSPSAPSLAPSLSMRAPSNDTRVAIFGGRSNPALAQKVAEAYGTTLGDLTIRDFADGEIYVHFEESIRGADLFIIQSTHPTADNWMELLLLIDAAKRASAERVTAVIPYFGYARQERKDQPRVSAEARFAASIRRSSSIQLSAVG